MYIVVYLVDALAFGAAFVNVGEVLQTRLERVRLAVVAADVQRHSFVRVGWLDGNALLERIRTLVFNCEH